MKVKTGQVWVRKADCQLSVVLNVYKYMKVINISVGTLFVLNFYSNSMVCNIEEEFQEFYEYVGEMY